MFSHGSKRILRSKCSTAVNFPAANASFDVVLFSDVLHHTADPTILLREASRVAARHVLIKDHYREGFAANTRLRFMDWVGNARFGVALPYNYWTERQWHEAWQDTALRPDKLVSEDGLYTEARRLDLRRETSLHRSVKAELMAPWIGAICEAKVRPNNALPVYFNSFCDTWQPLLRGSHTYKC